MLKFKRIRIRIGFPFCVTALIMLSGQLMESYIFALSIAVLHETGHLIAMIYNHIYPDSITFTPTGIRINCPSGMVSPRAECIISASGPVVNILLMPILYLCLYNLPFYINAGLLIINLLPLRSLDAGRFLYNLIIILKDELYAEKIMNITETAVCFCLVLFLVFLLMNNVFNPSFIMFTVMVVVTTIVQVLR